MASKKSTWCSALVLWSGYGKNWSNLYEESPDWVLCSWQKHSQQNWAFFLDIILLVIYILKDDGKRKRILVERKNKRWSKWNFMNYIVWLLNFVLLWFKCLKFKLSLPCFFFLLLSSHMPPKWPSTPQLHLLSPHIKLIWLVANVI